MLDKSFSDDDDDVNESVGRTGVVESLLDSEVILAEDSVKEVLDSDCVGLADEKLKLSD